LLFLFYINDLPQLVKDVALPILFADDTSFLITNSSSLDMNQDLKLVLEITQKWFKSNIMLLNYDKDGGWDKQQNDLSSGFREGSKQ